MRCTSPTTHSQPINANTIRPSRRTPSTLDEVKIEIQLRSTVLTQHGTLPSPLKLVRVDEPTNDEAVQVYDVEDLRVSFGEGRHAVVARTMKDPHQKISVDPELVRPLSPPSQ